MITVNNISKHFGGIKAVDNVSINIKKGTITGLIGPNGAGKTTLFNIIAGLHAPESGTVLLDKQDVTGFEPYQLFHLGLLRTFQIAHEFSSLTVLENLLTVPPKQIGESITNSWFKRKQIKEQELSIIKKANEVISFLGISHLKNELAGNISGGQKKLLELGRTMMVEAKIVLLDEVGAGVNRTLLRQIGDAIVELNKTHGYTFFMIEHDVDFISRLCDTVIVMADGKLLTQGSIEEIKQNEKVIEAYLGKGRKK